MIELVVANGIHYTNILLLLLFVVDRKGPYEVIYYIPCQHLKYLALCSNYIPVYLAGKFSNINLAIFIINQNPTLLLSLWPYGDNVHIATPNIWKY